MLAIASNLEVKVHARSAIRGTWTAQTYRIVAFDEEGFPLVFDLEKRKAVYLQAILSEHRERNQQCNVELL